MTRASKPTKIPKLLPKEGLIHVSFNFDGKRFAKSHQLSEYELKLLKTMLAEYGQETHKSVTSKAAIKNTAILAENVLAVAFLEFIKTHHKIVDAVAPVTMAEAIEVLKKESDDASA